MTTKEFTRRLDYFSKLDGAASCFSPFKSHFIYRIVLGFQNRKDVFYSVNISTFSFNNLPIDCCDFLYFDKYTESQFEIDLKYFQAYLSRLSSYQYQVLVKSHKCDNLFELLSPA